MQHITIMYATFCKINLMWERDLEVNKMIAKFNIALQNDFLVQEKSEFFSHGIQFVFFLRLV